MTGQTVGKGLLARQHPEFVGLPAIEGFKFWRNHFEFSHKLHPIPPELFDAWQAELDLTGDYFDGEDFFVRKYDAWTETAEGLMNTYEWSAKRLEYYHKTYAGRLHHPGVASALSKTTKRLEEVTAKLKALGTAVSHG